MFAPEVSIPSPRTRIQIALRAGVSVRSVYRYYRGDYSGDKGPLPLVERAIREAAREVGAALPPQRNAEL